jgi:hypothetical protein
MADLTITAANVLFTSGTKEFGVAGASITAGQALYLDSATNTLKLTQCDGTAAEAAAVGIALNAAGTGQTVGYARTGATINIGATTAKTTTYMVSAAAGGVAPNADIVTGGHRLVQLGYATDTAGVFVVQIVNRNITV